MVKGAFLEPGEMTTCSMLCATHDAIICCANLFFGNCGIKKIFDCKDRQTKPFDMNSYV